MARRPLPCLATAHCCASQAGHSGNMSAWPTNHLTTQVLEYYYRGVASWTWFYPHHYAPMASDLTGLPDIRVAFLPGAPFRPFEQLLAVLPSASCKLLPRPFQARLPSERLIVPPAATQHCQ